MAGKTKPGSALKGINIKLKMINDLMDVTGSAKDSWNPAEISDDMKAIAYIHDLADTWNPAQLNEALKYLGFATIDSWNPAIIEETKNKLVKYFLPTEATGNPITFNTYGNLPYEVSKAEVTFLPKQDLHGYDNPWVGGAGKNVVPLSAMETTKNGVTISTVYDSANNIIGYKLNGTANAQTDFAIASGLGLEQGTNRIIYIRETEIAGLTGMITPSFDRTTTSRVLNKAISGYAIRIDSGTVLNNAVVNPMICYETSGSTFAPYSNECTISGWTEVNLYVDEEQSLSPANTYTESLGSTYYGGKVDFVSGKLTIDTKYSLFDGTESGWTTRTGGAGQLFEKTLTESITQSDTQIGKCNELNWNNYLTTDYSYRIRNTTLAVCLPSSYSTVDSFQSWLESNNLQITYPLNTPIELTLTPQEIELLKGQNVIWTDGDDILIEYKALLNS